MKHLTSIILFTIFLFSSCNKANIKEENTEYIFNELGHRFKIIEIDSCEYLFSKGAQRVAITHKGNCKFCEKRIKQKEQN